MKVLKFGGTSVQNAENINKVIAIVEKELKKCKVAIVVSAFGGITEQLIKVSKLAASGDQAYKEVFNEIERRHLETINGLISPENQAPIINNTLNTLSDLKDLLKGIFLIQELSPRSLDLIQSFGERLSASIIASAFTDRKIEAEYLDARQLIKTDKKFNSANVNFPITNNNIFEHFQKCSKLQVIPGFIGSSIDNETTTLGRGGSDYSGAILSAALHSDELEIWTDVDGMMTSDPRIVKKAFLINRISYKEALELSHFGSKVIHAKSIVPALNKKIPIRIKNTFNPDCEGTLITEKSGDDNLIIRGISSVDEVSLLTIQGSGLIGVVGFASRLFSAISKESINIILITQGSSEHSITFAVPHHDSLTAKELIEDEFKAELQLTLIEPIRVESDLCIIAVVGENMKNRSGISARLFGALGRNGISVVAIAQGSSELNISLVINKKHKKKALNAIHEDYFLSDTKTINLFISGTGTIGGTLLDQINKQREYLAKNNSIDIKVIGIINIDYQLFDEEGIDTLKWQELLEQKGSPCNVRDFVTQMKEMNLRNSIFVDNTASKEIAGMYEEILTSSISVVTPNKIANSSDYQNYTKLHKAASKYGVKFLYETNVGAGLPIINTLKDLIHSGDKILKIEAILSGSLNYIFSSFSSEKNFYDAVKEAKELGFTEPDPRQDLSGMDVGRKILILSREVGLKINLEDVNISSCISKETQNSDTIEEFWKNLKNIDLPHFEERREKAEKQGKRLRYIATLENEQASASIKEVSQDHPFYSIMRNNNIIAFTTERYHLNPLIVIGPGAGAEVTAAGIFADIIRIVNF